MVAAAPPVRKSALERIPDPAYAPRRGDHAMIFGYGLETGEATTVLASVRASVYEDYWNAIDVGDTVGVAEMIRGGDLVAVPQKTGVLVLEVQTFPKDDPRFTAAVVRIDDGPLRGAKYWVPVYDVTRLVANPDYVPRPAATPHGQVLAPPPSRPTPPARQDNSIEAVRERNREFYELPPEERRDVLAAARRSEARSNLDIAENLRKSRKWDQARKYYTKLVKEYSDLPEAKTAKERLKALPRP